MPDVPVVGGTRRAFWAQARTAEVELVWRRWTTPATWGTWDRGLRSATLDGDFVAGATGRLVDTAGRTSRFVVAEVDEQARRCVVDVALPGAVLRLTRSVDGDLARHEVAFTGPAGPVLALLLGGRFRRRIGPTVSAVAQPHA